MTWSLRSAAVPVILGLLVLGVQAGPASAAVTPEVLANVAYPIGIAEDAAGNIYLGNNNSDGGTFAQGLVVIPKATGTLFGQAVEAGTAQLLFRLGNVAGVAVDGSGDVFAVDGAGDLYAVAPAPTTLFGTPVAANTLTVVRPATPFAGGLEFDAAGNLFGAGNTTALVSVLPLADGVIFGEAVTANTPSEISALNQVNWNPDIAFDAAGNLYVTEMFDSGVPPGVYVLPKASGTLLGQSVTVNVATEVDALHGAVSNPCGISIDSSGNIFIGDWGSSNVVVLPTSTTTLFDESVTALTATTLAVAKGYANQGILADASGNLISGGNPQTWFFSAPTAAAPSAAARQTLSWGGGGGLCTTSASSGSDSSWVATPSAQDCSRSGYTLLGWATRSDFPLAIAHRQVDRGWGVYEWQAPDGAMVVFIPAGKFVCVTGDNSLIAIWAPLA